MTARCYLKDASGKPVFRYTHSSATDIRKTIARERKRLAEQPQKVVRLKLKGESK